MQKPYTFAIHTSQRLTKNCKRAYSANADRKESTTAQSSRRLTHTGQCASHTTILPSLAFGNKTMHKPVPLEIPRRMKLLIRLLGFFQTCPYEAKQVWMDASERNSCT